MTFNKNRYGSIDVVSVMILYLIYAMFVIMTFVASIQAYQSITVSNKQNYELRTSLQYISNKVKAYKGVAEISVKQIGDRNAIVITENIDGKDFDTYIFDNDNKLCELFIEDGTEADPQWGTVITEVKDFKIEEPSEGFIKISNGDLTPLIVKCN